MSNEHVGNDELCRKNATISGSLFLPPLQLSAPEIGFKNRRQLAAWLGLVPLQRSSVGKHAGARPVNGTNVHIRTLLFHGAKTVGQTPEGQTGPGKLAGQTSPRGGYKKCCHRSAEQQKCQSALGIGPTIKRFHQKK
ncbi:transposase [Escherichia coli]